MRPSDLVDAPQSAFVAHAELQNGIFDASQTSRSNVGEFMADLVTKEEAWARWSGGWPHVLNVAAETVAGSSAAVEPLVAREMSK